MEVPINPRHTKVLLMIEEVGEQTTESGIILADSAVLNTPDTHKATVLKIGPEVEDITVGDLVLITGFVGDKVTHEQVEYRIVDEFDVLATIER